MTVNGAGPSGPARIANLRYKPGWSFRVGGPRNRFLCIFALTPDAHHPERNRTTQHMFEMPDTVTERWAFDQILLAELHEAGEFFQDGGRRPFYPNHQDEGSPYELVDRSAS